MDNSRFDITDKCVQDFDPYRSAVIFLKHNSDINGISNLLFWFFHSLVLYEKSDIGID